jgi:hypothetical protein
VFSPDVCQDLECGKSSQCTWGPHTHYALPVRGSTRTKKVGGEQVWTDGGCIVRYRVHVVGDLASSLLRPRVRQENLVTRRAGMDRWSPLIVNCGVN